MNSPVLPPPERMFLEATDLETQMDAGAMAFGKYFSRLMDGNGWSHPQLVALCKKCTGDKAWLHSSQIAGLRAARLKSPGPRSFVALEYLFRAIDQYQKGGFTESRALFGSLSKLVDGAEIMRDENGNPASLGYLVELFTGLREVPIDLSTLSYSEKQAEKISEQAGRLIRKLMAVDDLDPITDAVTVATQYSGTSVQRVKLVGIIKGAVVWEPEEIEEALGKLAKLLREQFSYKRTAAELREEFL